MSAENPSARAAVRIPAGPAVPSSDGPPNRLLLPVLAGNMLLDAVEVSLALVAVPSVGRDLHLSSAALPWVVSAFALGFGGSILAGGRVVAVVGRRRAYLTAVLVFAAASLAAPVAHDFALLLVTRVVKGGCAALTAPTGLAIIRATYPEGPKRNRAISVYTLFGAAGFSTGLLLGGMLAAVDWRLAFGLPAPIALGLALAGLAAIPAQPSPEAGRAPLLPRQVIGSVVLWRSALGAATLNGSYIGLLFLCSVELQFREHWRPVPVALLFLLTSVPLAASALRGGRLVARWGTTRLIAFGAVIPPLGYAGYLFGDPRAAAALVPVMLAAAAGFVLCFAAYNLQAISSVPPEMAGQAAGLYQTAVQLGGAVVPAVAALLSFRDARAVVFGVGVLGALLGFQGYVACRRSPQPRGG